MNKPERALATIMGVVFGLCILLLVKVIVNYQPNEFAACVAYQEKFVGDEYPRASKDAKRIFIDKRVQ